MSGLPQEAIAPAGPGLAGPGSGRGLRFRELLQRLFSMANQGSMRLAFLRMASGAILEFLACEVLELRLLEAEQVYRCRAEAGGEVSRFLCAAPAEAQGPDPEGTSAGDRILDALLRGRLLPASPFSTRAGSLWTGDANRPVLLREAGSHEAAPCSVVIGGGHLSLALVPVPVDERIRGILLLGCRKPDQFSRDDVQLFEAVGQTLGVAVAFQAAQWALRERVKELDCLYGIAKVAQRPGLALEEQLREIVGLLPPAWQYPELTEARITLDGQDFRTPGFAATDWLQEAELRVGEKPRGHIQVAYGLPMPTFAEGPFLREERDLIEEVAHQVGILVGRWEDEKARAKLFHMLEQRRE